MKPFATLTMEEVKLLTYYRMYSAEERTALLHVFEYHVLQRGDIEQPRKHVGTRVCAFPLKGA